MKAETKRELSEQEEPEKTPRGCRLVFARHAQWRWQRDCSQPNQQWLVSACTLDRWCGLSSALLGTTLVLHIIRGDGPIEMTVYLQVYALLLLPMIFSV